MLSLLKNNFAKSKIFSISLKSFAITRHRLRSFKKEIFTYTLKDLTKSPSVNEKIKNRMDAVSQEMIPHIKLSSTLKKEKKQLKFLPEIRPPKDKRILNKEVRSQAMKIMNNLQEKYDEILESRLFNKDHTAQILENVRKGIENKAFNRKLHLLRDKRDALKQLNRKKQYLIANYEEKFKFFENYNDTTNLISSKSKSFIDFVQPVILTNPEAVLNKQLENSVQNKLIEYKENINQLKNQRVENILKIKNSNPILEKFLEHRTSADINLIGTNEIAKNKPGDEFDLILNEKSNAVPYFHNETELALKIEMFESEVYQDYKDIDLYRRYKGRVEFSELTIPENLNYVKFYIKNTLELFKMFRELRKSETSNKENNNFLIYSSILQKMAYSIKNLKKFEQITKIKEYKEILVSIKPHFERLDNKNLVDVLWSVGRIHNKINDFSPNFFNHFTEELTVEISKRIQYLNCNELGFLCEGLSMLGRQTKFEVETLSDLIKIQVLKNKEDLTFFQISKILSYFKKIDYSDFDEVLIEIKDQIIKYVSENFDLIPDDLNIKQILDVVSAYTFANSKHKIQEFFDTETDEILFIQESKSTELVKTDENKPLIKLKIKEATEAVLTSLCFPLIAMRRDYLLHQTCMILYCYSNAELYFDELYMYCHKQLNDLILGGSGFNIVDVLHSTWGLSKYNTHKIFPNYNLDANAIIYPSFHEKFKSLKFETIDRFAEKVFEKKNFLSPKHLSIICYNLALMGYSNIDFYLPVFHNIKLLNQIKSISIEDVGYLLQSLSMLNYNDEEILRFLIENMIEKVKGFKDFKNDLALAHFSSSIVVLNAKKILRSIRDWDLFLDKMINYVTINYDEKHLHFFISVTYLLTLMEKTNDNIISKIIELIGKVKNKNYLTKYDKVVLAQILLLHTNETKEALLTQYIESLNKFEKDKKEIQKKISINTNEVNVVDYVQKLVKINENYFLGKGYNFKQNFHVNKSYIIPLYCSTKKLCIFFYDHSEILKDKSTIGYNVLKEKYLESLGLKSVRISIKEYNDMLKITYNDEKGILEKTLSLFSC